MEKDKVECDLAILDKSPEIVEGHRRINNLELELSILKKSLDDVNEVKGKLKQVKASTNRLQENIEKMCNWFESQECQAYHHWSFTIANLEG